MIKIYKWFVNIIFIIVIALLLVYLVFRMTDKVEIYRVKTGSMEEKIHVGDYIMIYRKSSYNVGDIVTYTSNDGFITHRIIRKEGNRIITKGDANNTEDREIVASTIVGEAIIIGGILNIVITYKYVIVCVLISLYLFSCYFGHGKKEEMIEEEKYDEDSPDIKEQEELKEEQTEIKEEKETKEKVLEAENKEPIEEKNDKPLEAKEKDDDKKEEIKVEEPKEEIKKEDTEKTEETLIKKKEEKK